MTKSKSRTEESFNWKGVKDNGDGTFDVADKYAKNRMMREFRKQGIRARSKRIGEKSFVIYPVGARKQRVRGTGRLPRKERQYYPGTKPRTRFRAEGPHPQLRQRGPGFAPSFVGRPPTRPVISPGTRKKGSIPQAIMKGMEKRAQKVREKQRSPYTPEGKPRPGYQTYIDKTGTQRIVKMPTGTWRDRFLPKEQKKMIHEARVQESQKVEKGIEERSKGQPSTRIPTPEERQQARTEALQREPVPKNKSDEE